MIEFNFIGTKLIKKCHELPPGTIFTLVATLAERLDDVAYQICDIGGFPNQDGASIYIFHGDPDIIICQRLRDGMLQRIHASSDCIVYNVTMELIPEGTK